MTLPVNGPLSEIRLARLVKIKVEGVTWAFGESLANLSDSHSKQQPGGSSLDLLWEPTVVPRQGSFPLPMNNSSRRSNQ
jgi:hypothetical protein